MLPKSREKLEIYKKLSLIPEDKFDEVKDFIEFILSRCHIQEQKPIKLRGIWKNKGFGKINDIESELKRIRANLTNSILNRDI